MKYLKDSHERLDHYFLSHRGAKSQVIFFRAMDFQYYSRLVRKYKRIFHIEILGYCFSPKAVHFVLRCRNAGRARRFIREVSQGYEHYFCARYDQPDTLWQTRCTVLDIKDDRQLAECVKFVEFYPVRINLSDNPVRYPYSSCAMRVLNRDDHMNLLAEQAEQGERDEHECNENV